MLRRSRLLDLALALVGLGLVLLASGCKKDKTDRTEKTDKTTHATSATMTSLDEKKAFVERYVTFRRTYTALEFKIDYVDGSGLLPGGTRADIRLFARVPEGATDEWTAGLNAIPKRPEDTSSYPWVAGIPNAPKDLGGFVWYEERGGSAEHSKVVGVSKATSEILYRMIWSSN
jgi:hypothetical protein